jgi:lipopolysaccharide biosynthesis glycosyltransferase
VDKYFDLAFPWFEKYGINSCRIASSQKTISKYAYGRFLVPFADVLQTYDRLLYMDNDCIAVRPIDQLLNFDTKSFITICFDGMCKDARHTEMRGFEVVKKYDIDGNASDYFCSGVLLFDMTKYDAQSWQATLQYMNTFNELAYKDINEVYCD